MHLSRLGVQAAEAGVVIAAKAKTKMSVLIKPPVGKAPKSAQIVSSD
jgi:hypothetical protein